MSAPPKGEYRSQIRGRRVGDRQKTDAYKLKAKCSVCGCTNKTPCVCADGNNCYWVNARGDLCSNCAKKDSNA